MLEKILVHIHNWFEVSIRPGGWTIENGSIELPFLLDGQYFRITGSVFNDGLHQYPCEDLTDEQFSGTIYGLAIPKAVIELSEEITEWVEANNKAIDSPYTSESFGGYSYTKGADIAGGGKDDPANGWQRHFMSRFVPWRKL